MTNRTIAIVSLGVFLFLSANSNSAQEKKGKSPADELPAHLKQVAFFGERPDWSGDGKKILFLSKTFGDAFEVELETGKIRLLTNNYYHGGYTRALYLANGDILLSGPRRFDPNDPQGARSEKQCELWVLKKDLSGKPAALGEHCSEGPAVSRKNMKIAWTVNNCIYMADIVYESGTPKTANKKKILDANDLSFKCFLETQNFRPPDEKELTFSAYEHQGTDVCGLEIETGKVVNYSNAPNQYDEPEGIFPDGKFTTVECDKHNPKGTSFNDIYKLALDGSGKTERLTFFSEYPGYKATNPVISDDGRFMAFHYARSGDWAGVGRGIFVFDLKKFEESKK